MKVTAVLFDLDGTLLDTIDLLLASVRSAFRGRTGRVQTTEEWIAGIGTPLESQLREYAVDDADLLTLVNGYRDYQRAHHDMMTRAYPEATQTVVELRQAGYRLGIVTSKASDIANRSLRFVGLDQYFDVVVGYNSTTRHKPDPEPVQFALNALRAKASETIFVGDSPHDMFAGNAAGVITVGALWGPFPRSALSPASPRYYLDRIGDLSALLEQLAKP